MVDALHAAGHRYKSHLSGLVQRYMGGKLHPVPEFDEFVVDTSTAVNGMALADMPRVLSLQLAQPGPG